MASMFDKEMRHAVEFLQDRLYYVALSSTPPNTSTSRHFFSIDKEMVYWNFYLDFGPLNLGHLYRFCVLLNNKLNDSKLKDKIIYFYSHTHAHKRTNAAYLITSWSLLYQNKSPEDAFKPFRNYPAPFLPWHDATPSVCSFNLTILDTLKGLYKAKEHKFFDFNRFNIEEYEHYEQVENGDLNWYMDGRFLGFAGPHAERECSPGGYYTLRPEDYIPYFKRKNVTLVVRLNKSYYDPKKFSSQGIEHMDLYFLDGSNPPEPILQRFIQKCEETTGAIAVHCKAGLGRTGTCIACYIMKHYRWTAEEIIGWMRIARPGSVIGPQQHFLKEVQNRMWREGEIYRQRNGGAGVAGVAVAGLVLPTLPTTPTASSVKSEDSRDSTSFHTPRGSLQGKGESSEKKRPPSGGIAMGAESSIPSTPPLSNSLQSRMNRMSLSTPPTSSPPYTTSTRSSFSSGKLPSSAARPPASPSFFDARPSTSSSKSSSSPPSTALSNYFRATPSAPTRPASSSRSSASAAPVSTPLEEEEGRSQGDMLRQRRAQHGGGSGPSSGASPGTGMGSPTSLSDGGSGKDSTPTGGRTRSGRTFNFLSSWK